MKFLVDRCAGVKLTQWLRTRGHDVLYAGERDTDPGDEELLAQAVAENKRLRHHSARRSYPDFTLKRTRDGVTLIPHPSSLIPHPSSLIPHPSSLIPHPSSLISRACPSI